MNSRNMKPFYHLLCIIARPLLKAFFKFQVFGLENVPNTGGVMLMINHASYLDPIVIGGSVNRNLYYMARSTLFRPWFIERFLTSLNAFPVRLGSPDKSAIKRAIQILNDGDLLLIFPEGTRSIDGTLGKAQDGVGFIAHRTNTAVVPVFVDGTRAAWPRGSTFIKSAKVTVSYGKPIDMSIYRSSKASRETYSKIGEAVMAGIAGLKHERELLKKGSREK
jgi:1-acyl-sn-glycerol-3-phosphate acyltransferase